MTILLVFSGLQAGACGTTRANQCPGNNTGGCVTGEVCSMDRGKGCMACQCAPLESTSDTSDKLDRRDPDDQTTPPHPVH